MEISGCKDDLDSSVSECLRSVQKMGHSCPMASVFCRSLTLLWRINCSYSKVRLHPLKCLQKSCFQHRCSLLKTIISCLQRCGTEESSVKAKSHFICSQSKLVKQTTFLLNLKLVSMFQCWFKCNRMWVTVLVRGFRGLDKQNFSKEHKIICLDFLLKRPWKRNSSWSCGVLRTPPQLQNGLKYYKTQLLLFP